MSIQKIHRRWIIIGYCSFFCIISILDLLLFKISDLWPEFAQYIQVCFQIISPFYITTFIFAAWLCDSLSLSAPYPIWLFALIFLVVWTVFFIFAQPTKYNTNTRYIVAKIMIGIDIFYHTVIAIVCLFAGSLRLFSVLPIIGICVDVVTAILVCRKPQER